MARLNKDERDFLNSIKKKVKKYNIPVTEEEIKQTFSGILAETLYNDKTTEIVDVEIENLFIKKSCNYFIRKYAVIPMPGKGYIPFDMYYIQEKATEEFEKHQNVIFLKSRQIGMSTLTSLYSLWKMLDKDNLHVIDIISATAEKAKEFKNKMDETLRRLPLFLFPKIKDKYTNEYRFIQSLRELPINNKTQLQFPNGSKFKCETASENAGRSDSLSLLILDEAAFFKTSSLIEEIWKSAGPTLSKTKGSSIIISTPNGAAQRGEWYYKRWHEAKGGNSEFYPIEIDWWEIPDEDKENALWLQELVDKDYHNNPKIRLEGVERATYEQEHINDNKWLKSQRDKLGEVTFRQEILHDFIISGESVFSSDKLKIVKSRIKEPLHKNILNGEPVKGLWIWETPIKKRNYIMGIDSSRGSGRDSSGIQVIDPVTYAQVAEFKGYISTKRFGKLIKKIARYYNNAYLVIECNNLGEAVFNEVYYSDLDPYDNLYRRTVKKHGSTITMGWDTTPALRILMTEEFINFITNDELFRLLKLRSERLYYEMQTWIYDGTKPIHSQGCVLGDTKIITENGIKEIKNINIGDKVLTHDGSFQKVLDIIPRNDKKEILRVKSFGKEDLYITSEHPFYLYNKKEDKYEWKSIEEIDNIKNYRNLSINKNKYTKSKFKSIKTLKNEETVYDLTVENTHSYIANGYIVHNCHDDLILSFCLALYNRTKLSRKINFILSSTDNVDYDNITMEDVEYIKQKRKFETNQTKEEWEEERKKDKFVKKYGVDYYDYSWLLGYEPKD